MSAFLQFVFPFGQTLEAQDTHFSGFRSATTLDPSLWRTHLESMGRSGLGFQHCFNLKSVEPYPRGRDNPHPWSIRPTAVYHSFDTRNGTSTWITIKGSKLMRDRINASLRDRSNASKSVNHFAKAFTTSLMIHMILVDWANEHWRWYINFLNDRFHQISHPVLSTRVDQKPVDPRLGRSVTRQFTADALLMEMDRNAETGNTSWFGGLQGLLGMSKRSRGKGDAEDTEKSSSSTKQAPQNEMATLGFKQIQKMGDIEEKVSEAKRVLVCNIDTLTALREHYQDVWEDKNFPVAYHDQCASDFSRFQSRLKSNIDDMKRHTLNLQNIQALLEVRKNVVSDMISVLSAKKGRIQCFPSQSRGSKY